MLEIFRVGEPFEGTFRRYPEGPTFNLSSNGTILRLSHNAPNFMEIQAVNNGDIEFGLYAKENQIIFLYKFNTAFTQDGLCLIGEAPYVYHLTHPEERNFQFDYSNKLVVTTMLHDSRNGVVRALRACTVSSEFSMALREAIEIQKNCDWDAESYTHELHKLFESHGSVYFWDNALVTCKGGD